MAENLPRKMSEDLTFDHEQELSSDRPPLLRNKTMQQQSQRSMVIPSQNLDLLSNPIPQPEFSLQSDGLISLDDFVIRCDPELVKVQLTSFEKKYIGQSVYVVKIAIAEPWDMLAETGKTFNEFQAFYQAVRYACIISNFSLQSNSRPSNSPKCHQTQVFPIRKSTKAG